MNKENRLSKKIISVLMCIAIIFGIAVPLYMSAFSENSQQGSGSGVEGLETSKVYDPVSKTLKLETYVTGETITTYTSKVISDIVLVLDITDSMKDKLDTASTLAKLNTWRKDLPRVYRYQQGLLRSNDWYVRWNESLNRWEVCNKDGEWIELTEKMINSHDVRYERMSALKIAVVDFIKSVADANTYDEKATNADNCRISIATFPSFKNNNKELSPLVPVGKDKDGNLTAQTEELISKVLNTDWVNSGTAQSTGLKQGLLEYDSYSKNKDKMMLLFTDGDPNSENASDDTTSQYNVGIDKAYEVKHAFDKTEKDYEGTTVDKERIQHDKEYGSVELFTVGMFDSKNTSRDNYMNYMSSRFPNAKSMSTKGTENKDKQYYYRVDESSSLSTIFEIISKDVKTPKASNEMLTKETILRDIISDEFTIDEESDSIHVYKQKYLGNNQWGERTELQQGTKAQAEADENIVYVDNSTDAKTVDVTGFDYSANWCGIGTDGQPRGYKLVVTIPIKPVDGAAGGTGVNTNDPESGIIDPSGNKSETFTPPKTDIPTDVVVKKVLAGNTPQSSKFTVDITASAHIIPGEFVDVDGYQQSKTEEKDYTGIVFDKNHLTYDGVTGLLVASADRPSKVTVTEKAVPEGYEVTFTDNKGHTSGAITANGGDVSYTFDVADGLEITVTNNKVTANNAMVTFKNSASGNMSNIGDEFTLGGTYYSGNKEKTLSGKLKDGEEKVVEDIDFGSTFYFYQSTPTGYAPVEVKVNGKSVQPDKNGIYTITVDEDTTVELINVNNQNVNVGLILEFVPYIVILAVVIAGIAVVVLKKKKTEID